MKPANVLVRVVAAYVAVCLIQTIAGMLSAVVMPVKDVVFPAHFALWLLLANAVTVAALSVVAMRSELRGWALGAVVASIPLAIFCINGIEGIIFLTNSHIDWPRIFLSTAIGAILGVPVWMLLFGKRTDRSPEHFHPVASKSLGQRVWRFMVCDVSYIVLYITAGTIIFPYIKDFYATQTLPPMSTLVALQLLVRGPAFILLCLLLVRMLGLPRWSGALAVGAVFTLLSGLAPLLVPNPYFPDSVRIMHIMEVTSSNFVFGAIVGWLWGPRQLAPAQALQQAA